MNLPDIIKGLRGIFERKRKNPLQLDNDSNLESNLKPLKVSNKSTPLQISEDTVDVKGSLKVNGVDVSTEPDEAGSGGASSLDELSDVAYSSGDLTISSLDKIVATTSLEIEASGGSSDILLDAGSGRIFFNEGITSNAFIRGGSFSHKEQSSAHSDSAGYGQIWVKNDTPNCLAFTDDAGTDIIGVGKYHYTVDVVNYSAGQLASFIPLGGYIIERTSTASANEFISMIAPYDGFLEKAMFRSEIAQNGTIQFDIHESSDGIEVPAVIAVATKDSVVNIADDTSLEIDFSSMTTGDNVLTKGRIYAFKITTPSNSFDTNVTLVFKWDITS